MFLCCHFCVGWGYRVQSNNQILTVLPFRMLLWRYLRCKVLILNDLKSFERRYTLLFSFMFFLSFFFFFFSDWGQGMVLYYIFIYSFFCLHWFYFSIPVYFIGHTHEAPTSSKHCTSNGRCYPTTKVINSNRIFIKVQ